MRINSPKQTKASRSKGAKSKGPKSDMGKQKVRMNALKDGLFSKDVVIESAGERKEDFERLKRELSEVIQPVGALEEMLVAAFLDNWWRRERIRRAESAELKNRLDNLWLRSELELSDKVEALKVQFLALVQRFQTMRPSAQGLGPITIDFEQTRQQLASTSLGLNFLILTMKNIEREAASKGQISVESELLVSACCGFASRSALMCRQVNQINTKIAAEEGAEQQQAEKKKEVSEVGKTEETAEFLNGIEEVLEESDKLREIIDRAANTQDFAGVLEVLEKLNTEGRTSKDKNKEREQSVSEILQESRRDMLVLVIQSASRELSRRQKLLEQIEEAEKKTTSAAILPIENSERFSRAETAAERRMYRALTMLYLLRRGEDSTKMLP